MKNKRLILMILCCGGLSFFNSLSVEATAGKTEIEVNILPGSSTEQSSENEQSSESNTEQQKENAKTAENKKLQHTKKVNTVKKTNDLFPKTGSETQQFSFILGLTLSVISGGCMIKNFWRKETNNEKN